MKRGVRGFIARRNQHKNRIAELEQVERFLDEQASDLIEMNLVLRNKNARLREELITVIGLLYQQGMEVYEFDGNDEVITYNRIKELEEA